ncbi:MAG TPA: hypothetical protein VGY53_00905 [Isosphaeraceae bacterium]|nr:hypothetical protein [Isosphaeraceae bacterium]
MMLSLLSVIGSDLPAGALSLVAYLDPGSGSFALQMLLATAFSGMYVLKLYWRRVRDFVTRIPCQPH